jgi:outer membrane autotransporter protein
VLQRLEERREAFVESDTRGAAADNQTLTLGTVGLYVSGNGEWIDQGSNRFETGYKSRDKGLTLGADVALNPMIIVGMAASFTRADAEYKEDGGGFSTDAYGITLYGSVAPIANLFIDATVGYVFRMHELRRRNTFDGVAATEINGIARSETESNEINTAVRAGYDFIVGPLTVGPRAGIAFRSQAIDSFREFGREGKVNDTGLELSFSDQTRESLTTSLGVYLSYAIPLPLGVLVPQITAEYVHEFLDDQRVVYFRFVEDQLRAKLRFQTAPPDRDYGNISAGILWVLPRNVSAFLNYRTLVGYEERSAHSITGGIRVTFK